MDAFAEVQADSRDEAWEMLATLPDNAWELDFPELIDELEDDDSA
jgi:hypothetical protein